MRFAIYSLMAGLVFVSLPAMAEDGGFGASMFMNESPAALDDAPFGALNDEMAAEASLLDAIEPAAGDTSSGLDDGWLPATDEASRLDLPETPVVPGMDVDSTAE